MKGYSVVFATDENYIEPLSVALISLLINNPDSKFDVYIICSGMGEADFLKLQYMVNNYQVILQKIEVSNEMFKNLITKYHFTNANYYRLLIPKLIKDDIVLYLDVDTVINSSIKDLFSIDLRDNFLAAVLNPGFNRHQELKMSSDSEYFNSGVMLINNKLWKENCITEKVMRFIENNPHAIEFVDQCGLNAIINGKWLKLPLKVNQQSVIFEKDFEKKYNCFSDYELKEARENPVIIHYTGSSKPWHFRNNHPYKYLYWKYLGMTPFKRYVPENLTIINVIKWLIPSSLKRFIKEFKNKKYG